MHTGWRAKVKPAPDREVDGRNEPEGEVQRIASTAFRAVQAAMLMPSQE